MKTVKIIATKRIVASCEGKRVTCSYDHALSASDNHLCAAKKLASKNKWRGKITGESNAPRGGYQFVFSKEG